MALHDDLLEQSRHLANRERTKPRQASLRRSISTAYYALFHLLIAETVAKWRVAPQRGALSRMFEHGRMNAACRKLADLKALTSFRGDPVVVSKLALVARAFCNLYDERQSADYDTSYEWTRSETLQLVELAEEAFQALKAVRNRPETNDYLLSLFVKERR
jgi:uncharacterized protein (UPF0332 family)